MAQMLVPSNDYLFKKIFGIEENKDVLLAFLNRTFLDVGQPGITELIHVEPYTDDDAPLDKYSIINIQCKTTEGQHLDVDLHIFDRYDMQKSKLYDWNKLYSDPQNVGPKDNLLPRSVTIFLSHHSFIQNDQYHNVFYWREDSTESASMPHIQVHFIELRKLEQKPIPMKSEGLVNWLLFFRGVFPENWGMLTTNEPMLKKAMATLETLSQDEHIRYLYEGRKKFLHDEASMMEGAYEEGLAVGIVEGVAEGIEIRRKQGFQISKEEQMLATVIALLKAEVDLSIITSCLGLSEEEVRVLPK